MQFKPTRAIPLFDTRDLVLLKRLYSMVCDWTDESLERDRDCVVAIGREMHERGGLEQMLHAFAVTKTATGKQAEIIDSFWHGIGDWRVSHPPGDA